MKIFKRLFLFCSVLIIAISFSGAYFTESASISSNSISMQGEEKPRLDPARVVINEVMYDPIGDEPAGEWVEIFNAGGTDIDLENYVLTDGEASLVLPSFNLMIGSYAVYARSALTFYSNYGFYPDFASSSSGEYIGLANGGDDIALYDGTGAVVDAVTWKNGSFSGVTAHPGVATAQGSTIARDPDGIDTNDCSVDFVIDATPTPRGSNV